MGIIPALAGSTHVHSAIPSAPRDHPRACGEHTPRHTIASFFLGSSPRLRGAPSSIRGKNAGDGIIPALAGSTKSNLFRSSRYRDHPRACGEHRIAGGCLRPAWGSSPRLRGAPHQVEFRGDVERIIPALAGSTCTVLQYGTSYWDHPRACGEHWCSPCMLLGG